MNKTKIQAAFTHDYLTDDGQLTYGDVGLHLLDELPWVEYSFLPEFHDVVTPDQIADIDALFLHDPAVTSETFSQGANRLIVIARCGVGYDHIDTHACTAADVALVNAPEAMRFPTAAAALMYILVLAKRLWFLDDIVRKGHWDLRSDAKGFEPRGRTLGIVGFGNIGRELARLVAPMEMRVLAYDPFVDPQLAVPLGVTLVPLETLLRDSDFVSLHCLLTAETRGFIGARELALMKPTAYLINMARGPVVDHDALVHALSNKQIAGAGLDVFYQEPLPADDPLIQLDNVVLSPHWAAGTVDVYRDSGISNIKDILQIARGELPNRIVNRDVIDRPGFRTKLARFQG